MNEQDDEHLEASQISAGVATLTMLESRNAGEGRQEDGGSAALKNKVKRSLFNETSSPVEGGAKTSGAGGGHSSLALELEADTDSALKDTSMLYIESSEADSMRSQQGGGSAADDRRPLATAQHTTVAGRGHEVPEASPAARAEPEKARESDATLRTEPATLMVTRNTLSAERSSASNQQAWVGAVPTRLAARGLVGPAKSTRVGPAPPSRARWVLDLHSIAIRPGIAQQYAMCHVMGACYSETAIANCSTPTRRVCTSPPCVGMLVVHTRRVPRHVTVGAIAWRGEVRDRHSSIAMWQRHIKVTRRCRAEGVSLQPPLHTQLLATFRGAELTSSSPPLFSSSPPLLLSSSQAPPQHLSLCLIPFSPPLSPDLLTPPPPHLYH